MKMTRAYATSSKRCLLLTINVRFKAVDHSKPVPVYCYFPVDFLQNPRDAFRVHIWPDAGTQWTSPLMCRGL